MFDPSPGRSTIEVVPGSSAESTSSCRLSEPIPGPPGRNNQLSGPGRSVRRRKRTPEGVQKVLVLMILLVVPGPVPDGRLELLRRRRAVGADPVNSFEDHHRDDGSGAPGRPRRYRFARPLMPLACPAAPRPMLGSPFHAVDAAVGNPLAINLWAEANSSGPPNAEKARDDDHRWRGDRWCQRRPIEARCMGGGQSSALAMARRAASATA